MLRAVTANIQRIADGGVSAAEQATMTLDALGTKARRHCARSTPIWSILLYTAPAEFAALFQKAAAMQ